MSVYYMDNVLQGRKEGIDFLLDILFSFQDDTAILYFEYGYSYINEFPYDKEVVNFEDTVNRIWYHPKDKEEAKLILNYDFLINCIVLKKDKDINSCKYRLRVVESPESIELMITENEEGDFQKRLSTRLKPFLEQGVKITKE
ncbi:hypothetical protein H1230_19235 [Paenibacillus sp. 19GGS1-52]|uniref:hypothetical protein n=1 Tax=Paenibacillus sp. 19GGS1-52 TaxID=2758563 RepID=UPI001EFA974F|nr:hypothetical protein [Paenibacillus sp. 19GGS1-52]ULO05238.1 hypothetical protein H1230_19235 [Paenibacillus sp. 19GGS1-52]